MLRMRSTPSELTHNPVCPSAVTFRVVAAIDDSLPGVLVARPPQILHLTGRRSPTDEIAFLDGRGRRAAREPALVIELLRPAHDGLEFIVLDAVAVLGTGLVGATTPVVEITGHAVRALEYLPCEERARPCAMRLAKQRCNDALLDMQCGALGAREREVLLTAWNRGGQSR